MTTEPQECKQDAGVFTPIIDRNRCEGKADCVPVCPYIQACPEHAITLARVVQ